jgi:hypothetical protein
VGGFFRGTSLSISKNLFSFMIFFTNLENFQQNIQQKSFDYLDVRQYPMIFNHNLFYFSSAAISKAISNLLCSPINVLKTRFEVVGDRNPKILAAVK